MSVVIEYLLKHPELVEKLPKDMLEQLMELVRMEKMRLRGGGGGGWLPPSAIADMEKAVPTDLIQSIVGDNRRGVSEPGWLPAKEGAAVERGSGWSNPVPLEGSVPGIRHIDDIARYFDRLDRKER